MIYCIWYASGAFGHYLNVVLSVFGKDFVRPKKRIKFNDLGDLHYVDLALPKYFHNPSSYDVPALDNNKNYVLLIDNGIGDESDIFKKKFPDQKYIKICYTDKTWPIVAKTSVIKAMRSSLEGEISLGTNWPIRQDWSIREKYFLYLRDHAFRYHWKPDPDCLNITLETLFDYPSLCDTLEKNNIICDDFKELHDQMLWANHEYFSPIVCAEKTIYALKTKEDMDLSSITGLWDQAVINYFIQLEFGLEIAANDYADWFQNTAEIQTLL